MAREIDLVETVDQIERVAELARQIWLKHYSPIVGRDQVEYMLQKFQSSTAIAEQINNGYEYYLISARPGFVGYMALVHEAERNRLNLSKLYILEEKRGGGYGTALLCRAMERGKQLGLEKITLRVNKHNKNSINWYKERGFVYAESSKKSIGSGYYMDDYIMQLSL